MTRNEYVRLCENIVWGRVRKAVLEMEFIDSVTACRIVQRLREVEANSKEATQPCPATQP